MAVRFRIGELIAYFFRSLLWSLNLLLALYTLLGDWLLYKLPVQHWTASMIMLSLPIAWVINAGFVAGWLFSRPWRSWLSGLTLLISLILFGPRTFAWHTLKPTPAGRSAVRIFSYNVEQFKLTNNRFEREHSSERVQRMLTYILQFDAPIKCFQEFYNSKHVPGHNLLDRFRQAGYVHAVLLDSNAAAYGEGGLGTTIFSKYPILQSGRTFFWGLNGVVWADINTGRDTIRVINVHLHSMGIRVNKVLMQNQLTGVKHETHGVLSALRFGFIERQEQVGQIEALIRVSPYPVIVTGDHNETPYSVVYQRLRWMLPNSFEDAGHGFGFTYNHPPGFIRIDHQFHDPRLPALNFETINSVGYSDHYPIVGTYALRR